MDRPALTADETAALVADLRINKPGARDDLILGHVRLGRSIVSRIASKVGQRSELTSVMMLALVEAVDEFTSKSYDDNITGYIVAQVHHAISDHLNALPIVGPSVSAQRVRKTRGQERIAVPQVVDIYDARIQQIDFGIQQLEVNEVAESLCINDQEREVLRLRLADYSDSEIGEQMGLTRWIVWSIRQGLQERYRNG